MLLCGNTKLSVAQGYVPIIATIKAKLYSNSKSRRYISLLQSEDTRERCCVNLAICQIGLACSWPKAICIFDIDRLIIKPPVPWTLIRIEIDANKLVTAGVNELRHALNTLKKRACGRVQWRDAFVLEEFLKQIQLKNNDLCYDISCTLLC